MRPLLILLACAFLLYAAFPTHTYYWDGVLFALNIEDVTRGQASPVTLFHPNHLLYSAFGYSLYRVALACGFTMRAIAVLQIFNTLASVGASAVLYAISRRLLQSRDTALFCATLFAFGATWWKFSTDADSYILTVLLLLLAIWFAIQSPPRLWCAALCHIFAMLFHQLAIFAYPVILAAILLEYTWPKRKRIGLCAAYVAATAACVTAAYWICYSQADHSRYPTLLGWATSFASDSGFTHSLAQIGGSLASYLKLFAGGKFALIRQYLSLTSALAFAICLAALIAFFGRFRGAGRATPDRRAIALLWTWAIPYLIFFASWDPGSAFHKLLVWPPIVLLIATYVPYRYALAIAIAAWNFGAFIYPHSHASADPVLVLAQKIDRELPPNAVIYYSAFSPDDWYLDYFAPGRKWIKLNRAQDVATRGPVCAETTALALKPPISINRHWELVNAQHNIRLGCQLP